MTQSGQLTPSPDDNRHARRSWILIVLPGCVLGAIAACFTMYVAWQHNPQSEFWDEEGVHWLELGAVGASWFLAVSTPVVAVAYLIVLFNRRAHADHG